MRISWSGIESPFVFGSIRYRVLQRSAEVTPTYTVPVQFMGGRLMRRHFSPQMKNRTVLTVCYRQIMCIHAVQCIQATIAWKGKAPRHGSGCWRMVSTVCYLPRNYVCFLDVPKDRERNPGWKAWPSQSR